MTNLKKTLAVVLAFAMILSMGAISTFAYTDVAEGTIVSEAVGILSNLNILTGFEDGTFRPDETVTRAQMAAIICRLLGYEDQAQSSMGSTVFNDVAADHWASGYVNVAQAQQIINGYGDGNYGPEDKVTYEQAVKMIVSALGYDLAATAKGGYPTGYLAIASAEGITKKANGKVGDAAARSTIAVLAYNALEVNLFEQDKWTTDGGDEYSYAYDNILTRYLDVTKVEGVLEDAPIMEVAKNKAYKADVTPTVNISNMDAWGFSGLTYKNLESGVNYTTVNADKVDVNAYLGKNVIAYIAEDEVTGVDTVVAIVENSAKNIVKKISGVQLADSDERYYDVAGTIGYKEVGSTRIEELDLATGAVVYTNYAAKTTSAIDAAYLEGKLPLGGTIEFISNDGDSDYDYVLVTAYTDEDVITSVEEYNGEYAFESKKGSAPDLDTAEEDGIIVVYKDGVAATAADIAVNDTVSVVELGTDCYVVYASSATVTGVVDSYSNDDGTVSIAGTEYAISAGYNKKPATLSGEEGIYFLNVDGEIAYSDTAPTAVGKYALVTRYYTDTVVGETVPFVEAVLSDGSVVAYEIKDGAKVKKANGEEYSPAKTVEDHLKAIMTAEKKDVSGTPTATGVWYTTVQSLASNVPVVKLTISNDKVTALREIVGASTDSFNDKEFNAYSTKVDTYSFDEGTVVFSVKQDSSSTKDIDNDGVVEDLDPVTPGNQMEEETAIDAEDVKVGSVADFMVDDEKYTGYAYDKDQKIYGVVVGLGMTQPIAVDSTALVVMNKKTTTIDDNDAYVITGLRGGEEVTITIYNEDDTEYKTQPSALGIGDVILIAEPDANGIVSNVTCLLDADREGVASVTPNVGGAVDTDDKIYFGYGLVTNVDTYDFAIAGGVKNEAPGNAVIAALANIDFESAANYVLVDYSESNTPEITTARGNKRLFDTDYVSYAYVRFVDGDLAEVVAYRYEGEVASVITPGTGKFTVEDAVAGATVKFSTDGGTTWTTKTVSFSDPTATEGDFEVTCTAAPTVDVKVTKTGYITLEGQITVS